MRWWSLFVALLGLVEALQQACHQECDTRVVLDEEDFNVACNDTCRGHKCHEGCDLWMEAISSSCHDVCEEGRKSFKDKRNLYCVRGCNIAINIYIKSVEDDVGRPPQPNLVAGTLANDSVALEWPPGPFPNISYLVQFRYDEDRHPDDWEYYRPSQLLKENYMQVQNLHPYTKYRFRVAWILLENYPPLFSEESRVISTLPYGVPSSAPKITCLTSVSATSVSVSWEPPDFPNGPISSYVLYIREYSKGLLAIKDLPNVSNGLHFMFNDLKPETTYIISLSTRNSMGEGPADTRNVTTSSHKNIPSSHHPPAYLVFAAKQNVLKQGLRIFDETQQLYQLSNDSLVVKGVAVYVKYNLLFVSDSDGNVHRVKLHGKDESDTVVDASDSYPSALSVDWLNAKLYMAEENKITRCGVHGNDCEIVLTNIKRKPDDLHVDPLNGYLYWTMKDPFTGGGGLYRIDLAEFDSACVSIEKAQNIVNDERLTAFAVDSTHFRILVPSASGSTVLSLALDGSDASDIRQNSQTRRYTNVESIAVYQNLLYWTNGEEILGEEYHMAEDMFYQNTYPIHEGPFSAINVHHSDSQPYPVPLNAVENVHVVFGDDVARVRWSKPRLLGGQGKGSWQKWVYELHLTDESNETSILRRNITRSVHDIHNLTLNTTYSIKVRAYSAGGEGPWSSEFTGTTLKYGKQSAPAYILWGAREGLLKSDLIGDNVEALIHKINLNDAHITDICWYKGMLFLNTNSSFVYTYNMSVHHSLMVLVNITKAASIAVDWLAPKLYWSTPTQQMISRSNLDGSQPEALPILTMAKEVAVDSPNGYLYWATSHSVECSRLNGMDHFVYMKHDLFSGKHVMGLTLDFEKKKIYWMIRSYEGSVLYRACLTNDNYISEEAKAPEVVGLLAEGNLHGPMWYFSNRLFWLHEGHKAFVSDMNGNNFAAIKGVGLNDITSLQIIHSSLQPYPDETGRWDKVSVVPESIYEDAIRIEGTWDAFNVTWDPVTSVNYGTVFYEIRVDDEDETYSLVTDETLFVYPTMKFIPPYTPITVAVRAYTYWASSKQTIVELNSPMSIPTKPLHPRVFITHKTSPVDGYQDIQANFRWSPPEDANGLILSYIVTCWIKSGEKYYAVCHDKVNGNLLQFQSHSLEPNTTYYFQVRASTAVGEGPPSDIAEARTSEERPVPRLLLAKTEGGVRVADIDAHEERTLYGKGNHPAALAYLAHESRVFWLEEEGSLMVASIDGSNTSLIRHLSSEGTSLTVDWIGRQLYWTEVDKREGFSSVWSVDLSYNSCPTLVFNRSSVITNLEVEPFSGSLLWTWTNGNRCDLMISDVSGSNARPFFARTAEFYQTGSNKVKRMTENNASCNCIPMASVGQAMTIDSTNASQLYILWIDGEHGHIWSSDIDGCICKVLVNATGGADTGLPPTSLTVDSSRIYWSNKTLGKIYSFTKRAGVPITVEPMPTDRITAEEIRGVRTIRAIGSHLQPYPDVTCLVSKSYEEAAKLLTRSSSTLTLYLPRVDRPASCNRISEPSVLYTILYTTDTSCFLQPELGACKSVSTHNSTVTLRDLRPFTNYTIRVSAKNYYSRGPSMQGPAVVYQTAVGKPSPPVNVTAVSSTPFRIDVEWGPPVHPNGFPILYEVRWRHTAALKSFLSVIYPETGHEDRFAMTIKTDEAGKDHFVVVRAYASNGELHSDSDEVRVTAYPLPNNLTLVNAFSRVLVVFWMPPSDGSVEYHALEYAVMGSQDWHTLTGNDTTPDSPVFTFAVQNLQPKTTYVMRLILNYRRKGIKFTWPPESGFRFPTAGDVPGVPGKPEVKHMGRDVYKVFWDEAFNYGHEELTYELQMRSGSSDDDPDVWILVSNSSDTQWIIESVNDNMEYEFRVRALNEHGSSNYSFSDKPFLFSEAGALIDPSDDTVGIIILSSTAVLIIFCLVLVALYMGHQRKTKNKKILQEVISSNQLSPDVELATLQDLPIYGNFVHQTNALYNLGDQPTDEDLACLPQVQRDQIKLTKFLGSGAFGEVYEGIACGLDDSLSTSRIAVKTLKKGATDHEKEEFLKEAKLMSNFKHDHILRLLGVCFESNLNFLILELMEGGDLLSFLRSHRPTLFFTNRLTMEDLINICLDVAEGCKYLEEMHYVHRDLAARNCLVSSFDRTLRVVKIGDFGLARDIYKNDYYRKEGEGLLPVRWMAPESLMDGVFTSQSDVWAFGVLLWEIMTLGQQPYPARANMEVMQYVKDGGVLDKPDNCPDDLHHIMRGCWRYHPDHRPTFDYCLDALEELKGKLLTSELTMPAVYNFNYLNNNLGTYIGRNIERENEERDKLLEQIADTRSTQSDPPTCSEMNELNPVCIRRSLSWTSVLLEPLAFQPVAVRKPGNLANKYLQLLGENEDSSGYQLPFHFHDGDRSRTRCYRKQCNIAGAVSSRSRQSAKSLPEMTPRHHQDVPSPKIAAPPLADVPRTSHEDGGSLSTDASSSEDCDNWSLSTASTATYEFDFANINRINSGISTLSSLSVTNLNYMIRSSEC